MPWNPHRKLPWRRLATFELMYVALFAAFVLLFERKKVGLHGARRRKQFSKR